MTGLDYNSYKQQLAIMAGYTVGSDGTTIVYDPNFLAILPETINYGELRIQRDLDFLATQVSDSSLAFTTGSNSLAIPMGNFVTLQTVEVEDLLGNTSPLLPVPKEYLQNVYGGNSTQALPQYFAMVGSDATITSGSPSNLLITVGPIPDQNYTVTLNGTIRFAPLSASNTQTFISTYLPDLFIMASMIYVSAFQRNFGKQADSSDMAISYESQYKGLLAGALTEEFRKKMEASAWTAYSPSPVATPSR